MSCEINKLFLLFASYCMQSYIFINFIFVRDVMRKGGTVVDTVIATAFCEGVGNPTTMGIGGGFLATIYHSGKAWSFDSRESAPEGATQDMFVKNHTLSEKGNYFS